ncbi:polyubiquitin protein [Spatholobus suberectus]|nr:polyubiquitin protein [Spatholobus suberectus]
MWVIEIDGLLDDPLLCVPCLAAKNSIFSMEVIQWQDCVTSLILPVEGWVNWRNRTRCVCVYLSGFKCPKIREMPLCFLDTKPFEIQIKNWMTRLPPVHHNFRLYKIKSMPFYSGICIICRNEVNVDCKSNLEKGSSGGNNSVPDTRPLPISDKGVSRIGGENNFSRETQSLPNADKEVLHIGGENNSARETQSLANADNEALQHVGKNLSGHLKRHQPKMPPILNESKKAREHMAVAVTSLTKKAKKEDNFSVDNVIRVLQAIPDLDDDLILDACDFLEDERRARMFLALAAPLRKKWLLRKLRS